MNDAHRSVVVVQYAGDYAEAYRRLSAGGAETYYAQRYSVDAVSALVSPSTDVTTICCSADLDEDCLLDNGVRSINMHSPNGVDEDRVWKAIQSCKPTHICFRTPLHRSLGRALKEESVESVLLTLADSFSNEGIKNRLRAWRLRRLLNHRKVRAIGNHGRNSSASLRRIGVDPTRIIPWDWPHTITPHQTAPKQARENTEWTLLFVGVLSESKGLGDVMRAVRHLKDGGVRVRLNYAGRGDSAHFAALAAELGIHSQVTELGVVSHASIIPMMRDADLVVIPSRHDYPEGFPMTIYEALTSRTPIVASDHPMYARHLGSTKAALVYEAANHVALAQAITKAMDEPALYKALSEASAGSWEKLQLPVSWGKLVTAWLEAESGRPFELSQYTMAAYDYEV